MAFVPLLVLGILVVPIAAKDVVRCPAVCVQDHHIAYDAFGVRVDSYGPSGGLAAMETYSYEDPSIPVGGPIAEIHHARSMIFIGAIAASFGLWSLASKVRRGAELHSVKRFVLAAHAAMFLGMVGWVATVLDHMWGIASAASGTPMMGLAFMPASLLGAFALLAKPTEPAMTMPLLPEVRP